MSPDTGSRSYSLERGSFRVDLLLVMAVGILGVAVTLSLWQAHAKRRQNDQIVRDVLQLERIFVDYRLRQGSWPLSADGGTSIPPEIEEGLKQSAWSGGTPAGGNYAWFNPVTGSNDVSIGLTAFTPSFPLDLSPADLRYLDQKLDDGNLSAGRFRRGFNGWPVFFIRETR